MCNQYYTLHDVMNWLNNDVQSNLSYGFNYWGDSTDFKSDLWEHCDGNRWGTHAHLSLEDIFFFAMYLYQRGCLIYLQKFRFVEANTHICFLDFLRHQNKLEHAIISRVLRYVSVGLNKSKFLYAPHTKFYPEYLLCCS